MNNRKDSKNGRYQKSSNTIVAHLKMVFIKKGFDKEILNQAFGDAASTLTLSCLMEMLYIYVLPWLQHLQTVHVSEKTPLAPIFLIHDTFDYF